MAYDFSILNDKEFEKLAMDILNAKFSFDLQSFKFGKDQGIDLRYSTPQSPNSTVVQAKHYVRSGYRPMIRNLKKEVRKVKILNPKRYIVVTSLTLSAKNKDEIFEIFKPFILTANDVFGSEDLNKYLAELPDIETRWYKLWLSSVAVLNKILNSAVGGRSAFFEEKIRRTIQLYVHSESYDDAFDILKNHKYILITGQPGVGKTVLAYLLTYYMLSRKYKLIYIDSDVKDAEDVFSDNPKTKQIFFFDDFLGANYLETINPKTSESKFVTFLERIKNVPNKYLILTTRTIIFRSALDKFEKLKRVKVDIARKEIELGQYSDLDKAKILYNHIYHSLLAGEKKEEIFKGKGYWKIITHRNYNPRLIEFITDPINSMTIPVSEYMQFILKNLDNPEEVWRHAYEQQLTLEEKLLLHAVFSQKPNSNAAVTHKIFDNFLQYEVDHYNYRPGLNPFNTASRKLFDGILKKELIVRTKVEKISFINPSLADFLTNYFNKNEEERWKVIKGSFFIEQFEQYAEYFFDYFRTNLVNIVEESSKLANHVMENLILIDSLMEENDKHIISLRIASFLNELYRLDDTTAEKVDKYSTNIISHFSIELLTGKSRKYFGRVIKYSLYDTEMRQYVMENWDSIIKTLIDISADENDFDEVKELFAEYGVDYEEFLAKDSNYEIMREKVSEYLDDQTKDWFNDEKSSILSENDWYHIRRDLKDRRKVVFSKFRVADELDDIDNLIELQDIEDVITDNINFNNHNESSELSNVQSTEKDKEDQVEEEIEYLFVGRYDPNDKNLPSANKETF